MGCFAFYFHIEYNLKFQTFTNWEMDALIRMGFSDLFEKLINFSIARHHGDQHNHEQ